MCRSEIVLHYLREQNTTMNFFGDSITAEINNCWRVKFGFCVFVATRICIILQPKNHKLYLGISF